MDFVHDQLINGQPFRVLTVVDSLRAWGRVPDLLTFDGSSLAPEAVSFQMPMIWIPPSWQRPASSASGGHRSDRRSILSNTVPISIPNELFLQYSPGRRIRPWQSVSPFTSKRTSMPRRELLSEPQRLAFTEPVTDERAMVRYYTLSAEDLALVDRRRGDPNRLGFAVMLCYLRFPGRILQQGERPPAALLAFLAEQLAINPGSFSDYAERDQTRRAHLAEIQAAFGYRPFTRGLYRELAAWLLPTALATEKGAALANGLSNTQRAALDQLLTVRTAGGQSTLAWLRQTAYAATAGHFSKLIERLRQVRALGIEP